MSGLKALIIGLIPVLGLLLFGTINSNVSKLVYEIDAPDQNGHLKLFRKPWAMTSIMFLGMTFSLLIVQIEQTIEKIAHKKRNSENGTAEALVGEVRQLESKKSFSKKLIRDIFLISIPAILDLLATVLMNAGLLSVTASVYQMLRGSEMLFAAIFSIVFLKRHLNKYNYVGLALSMAGITLVGLSSILSGQGGAVGSVTPQEILLGMFLIIVSQCIQAGQITFEDFFLTDLDISPAKIVGYEGVWGALIMFVIFLPIVYFLPGEEGDGLHENTLESFYMITHSYQLALIILLSLISCLFYNLMGMMVTGQMGAVFRTVLETMRTLLVWITGLIIFYSSGGRYGEEWTSYSFLQLLGFALLIMGTLTYAKGNKISSAEEKPEANVQAAEQEPLLPSSDQVEQQIEHIPQQGPSGEHLEIPKQSYGTPARITHSLVSSSYQDYSFKRRSMAHE